MAFMGLFDKLGEILQDDVETERWVNKLATMAPPPQGLENNPFFSRTPEQLIGTSQGPESQMAQSMAQAYANRGIMPQGEPPKNPLEDMAKLFAGNQDKPPEPHFAPVPSPGGPSRVQVQPQSYAGLSPGVGASGVRGADPLMALSKRLFGG